MNRYAHPYQTSVHDGHLVVRDDCLPGGTKRRGLDPYLAHHEATYFGFAGPAQGYAQLALAYSCQATDRQAVMFLPARKERHPYTAEAAEVGCDIREVPYGRLSVLQNRAREWEAEDNRRCFLPLGFDLPDYRAHLEAALTDAPIGEPSELWCVAGSGTLARCLADTYPDVTIHAVGIGRTPLLDRPNIKAWTAPEAFDSPARQPPPFPSCPHYDAKGWRFMIEHGAPDAVYWNVGR